MTDENEGRLTVLIAACGRALIAMAAGLIALGLGILTVVATVVGFLTSVAGRGLAVLGQIVRETIPMAQEIAPWLMRAGCVVVNVAGIWFALPRLYMAYGGDGAAALAAGAFGLGPSLAGWSLRPGWGTLLAAGVISAGVAVGIEALPAIGRVLVMITGVMVCATALITRRSLETHVLRPEHNPPQSVPAPPDP